MKEISVLVLDDEQNILNALTRLLRDAPYGLFATQDHEEALAAMDKYKIKAVLSDQRMPRITGVEFLKKIKSTHPGAVRILFTGHADMQAAVGAINEGEVYRFIAKPWNDTDLKATILHAVQMYDLTESNLRLMAEINRQNQELAAVNEQLKNLYEAQKEFSSTVSHELRTPLACIKMAVDTVNTEKIGPLNDLQRRHLVMAKKGVDRLVHLINDILDLTKLEAGKTHINLQSGDINALIREAAEHHRPVAEAKGLSLTEELAPDVPKFPFDADRLHQVVHNLVNNAIKFTEQGGVVVASTYEKADRQVKVVIRDTGYGIQKDDIEKLFQKFQQLGNPAERHEGGTGLGLAICKEIISQHRGRIWVESEYGRGSSFCFLLPADGAPADVAAPEKKSTSEEA